MDRGERLDGPGEPAQALGVGARREVRGVAPTVQRLTDESGEHEHVGPRSRCEVEIGMAGALRTPGIDDDDVAAAGAHGAQVAERVGDHHPVAVGHDGVHADGQQQVGVRQVGLELQLHAGHQLRHEELRRAVDAQRAVALAATEVAHERLGHGIARRVQRAARAGVVGDDVWPVLGDERRQAGGDVVERVVPRARHQLAAAADERDVEALRMVVEVAAGPALGAHVPGRPRVLGVARHPDHAVAIELGDRAAAHRTQPARRRNLHHGHPVLLHRRERTGHYDARPWVGIRGADVGGPRHGVDGDRRGARAHRSGAHPAPRPSAPAPRRRRGCARARRRPHLARAHGPPAPRLVEAADA